MPTLHVTQYKAFDWGLDTPMVPLLTGVTSGATSATAATILGKYNTAVGAEIKITGTGLVFNSTHHVTGGTITSMALYEKEGAAYVHVLDFSGLSFSVAAAVHALADDDTYPIMVDPSFIYSAVPTAVVTGDVSAYFGGNWHHDVITGSGGYDQLQGFGGADTIHGGNGDDSLDGGDGGDKLYGDAGNDFIRGGLGNDTVDGGVGTQDVFSPEGYNLNFSSNINLTTGKATGGYGTDTLTGIEGVWGTSGMDVITGNTLNNSLIGWENNDTIVAGTGNDSLWGGTGHDTLTGGVGADHFYFDESGAANSDTITDFAHGSDKIVLSNLHFFLGSSGTISPGNFHVGSAFSGNADYILYNPATGQLWFDPDTVNGSDPAQLVATLSLVNGVHPTVTTSDILLTGQLVPFPHYWLG